ncbi:HPr(Ser) kinase/phosphatase [Salinicoccus albus]|uniref:HPr(Ser) kinase/phosphatase n=1 Tax=Salinicoccus albus TaxID=418756 RepID=UPI00036BC979|nr:HPr(Ser) kinase/phosphatase [Salinicoccus albus]
MLTVKTLADKFDLKIKAGEEGLQKEILNINVSRPGLEIAGYFSHYSSDRVQVLGMSETSFFERMLSVEEREDRCKRLCRKETPCIIVSRDITAPLEMIEACNQSHTPLFVTEDNTTNLIGKMSNFLEKALAPETNMHGVFVDVYGIGVLITGESGVGKSETALELVKNGHRLVADDNVEIKQVSKNVLMGSAPSLIRNLLEIRGLGIINVMTLFGAGSVLEEKRIMLNVNLEAWQPDKRYERLGLDQEKIEVLDSEIDQKTIPIRPGRSLAGIIEVAAMNHRMHYMGYNAAQEFNDRLNQQIQVNGGMTDDL